MKIELRFDTKVTIGAIDDSDRAVAVVHADTLEDAVKALVSRFAEMQKDTIEALRASGLIRYVRVDTEALS